MNSSHSFVKFLTATLVGLTLNVSGYSEEAPTEVPPPNQATDEVAPEGQSSAAAPEGQAASEAPAQYQPEAAATASQSSTKEVAEDHREEMVFDRIKTLVKRFDAQERNGMEYPSKPVENAIRAEFMRRTEGGNGASWLKKRSRNADKEVAMDNLDLLVTYAEKLSWAAPAVATKKGKGQDPMEAKLLAAKAVIDKYNVRLAKDRSPASFTGFSPAHGLSPNGKLEIQRRRTLTASQVAGDDFTPITARKFDDYAKKYRQGLSAAVVEYEKLAKLIGGGIAPASVPAKKTTKRSKQKGT